MIARIAPIRDRRGVAAVEFALISLFLFVPLVAAFDFAFYMQQRLQLGNAVEQGAMIAFQSRSSAPLVNTASISTYIAAATGRSPATSFQCNGAATCDATSPATRCIGAPAVFGGWPSFTAPVVVASVATCPSGAAPGYYLVIRSSQTFRPLAVPDRWLPGKVLIQQTAIRL